MLEDEPREFLRWVGLAGLKPVHRDAQFRCEGTERLDAGCAGVGFESADVCVADAVVCELALAESQLEPALLDSVPDCGHLRRSYRASKLTRGKVRVHGGSNGWPRTGVQA